MQRILVTGDIAIDCHVIRHHTSSSDDLKWNDQNRAEYCERWGGAALLARLAEASITPKDKITVIQAQLPAAVRADEKAFLRSYATWEPQAREAGQDKKLKEAPVWRVKEFLGVQRAKARPLKFDLKSPADIVVIDDANLREEISQDGFCRKRSLWPEGLRNATAETWVVWKLWRRHLDEELGVYLLRHCPARLVLILSARGLREDGDFISKGVSWERTAQELYQAVQEKFSSHLTRKPNLQIIISLGAAGAFIYSGGEQATEPKALLVFDPQHMEDEWEDQRPGRIIGQTACLTTGVTLAIARNSGNPHWSAGIQAGLAAMRSLYDGGYRCDTPDCSGFEFPYQTTGSVLAAALAPKPDAKSEFAITVVPDPRCERLAAIAVRSRRCQDVVGQWSILQSKSGFGIYELARRIARRGVKSALTEVPVMSFGGLTTADRQEIESYRNIRNLFMEYVRNVPAQESESKPVSVAVFGPPGSGKSFGVKQIVKNLPGNVKEITFNLSQFSDPAELVAAFNLVRDTRLKGNIPLVFWDEFDTSLAGKPLGWLRCFLEPMQDGVFLDGQVSHPLGPAIFVFAGGTCPCFSEFAAQPNSDAYGEFKKAKGPDFVSRLRGYLNVLGPNPRGGDPTADPTYVIRRAILFASVVRRFRAQLVSGSGELDIDDGVLRAFLTVSEYVHGARSMESIVTSSALTGESRFDPYCLPQPDQLDLHVPSWEFMALVHYPGVMAGDRAERLTQAFHKSYCDSLRSRGYRYGPKSNDELKTSNQLVPWARLPQDYKNSNADAVRAIPDKLAAVGYVMVPGTPDRHRPLPESVFERLSELEHERWMHEKIAAGWRQSPPRAGSPRYLRDDKRKLHDAMLPWKAVTAEERAVRFPENPETVGFEELPEAQKEKDRDQVRSLLAVMKALDYCLVPSTVTERGMAPVQGETCQSPGDLQQ